jgi:hypothetical protein
MPGLRPTVDSNDPALFFTRLWGQIGSRESWIFTGRYVGQHLPSAKCETMVCRNGKRRQFPNLTKYEFKRIERSLRAIKEGIEKETETIFLLLS